MTDNTENLCINTIRLLSADAVQRANSGHPGMPMGAAAMAFVLWDKYLRFDPSDPGWIARDRFVLSAGHGSMLLYSLLHLFGFDLSMDDLKNFRQLGSRTPGHPEYGITAGVETTTGPLGQGFANAVGMAVAQKFLSAKYDRPSYPVFDYRIFALCSDGDFMEGISSEAASFAGHQKLGNLICLYDDNHISIEGKTEITFTEDTAKRFEAFGWHVQEVADGNDTQEISRAIAIATEEKNRPSLIKVRTHIGFGSPNKADTPGVHGSPLGEEELRLTKINLGSDPDKSFFVPDEVKKYFEKSASLKTDYRNHWEEIFNRYKINFPDASIEYENICSRKFGIGWKEAMPVFEAGNSVATRTASGVALNAAAKFFPLMIGGSADLEPSTDTYIKGAGDFQPDNCSGRNLHFGVREHMMGAVLNGICLTHPMTAYGSTFLIFSEYMRAPIRLAAIMNINPVYVFTHDSIGLGEDGTTHQPVEQLASLRSIPGLYVIRPCDANETVEAWKFALQNEKGPTALILSRQKLPVLNRKIYSAASGLMKGAYVLSGDTQSADAILVATGSEVHIALDAQNLLLTEEIKTAVVSMPSWEIFEKQSDDYKKQVFPPAKKIRVSVEAGSGMGWHKYVTDNGESVSIDVFGESAPDEVLMKKFGFTADHIADVVRKKLNQSGSVSG